MKCLLLLMMGLLLGCASTEKNTHETLGEQLEQTTVLFFQELDKEPTVGNSRYTIFIPEDTLDRRYRTRFIQNLQQSLRKAEDLITLRYEASAERIFFTSTHFPSKKTTVEESATLATEFQNGTSAGWTAFHTLSQQYNRLAIGDRAWVESLPDSVRTDLSHPIRYILRVYVTVEKQTSMTEYIHRIQYEMLSIGKEDTILAKNYTLKLTYPLN